MTDDAALLRRYAEERSEEAFADFVRSNINLVYSAALRRTGGDAHTAADVSQQVFISAARHAHALARHARLTGWLYSSTRNAAVNIMRNEHRRQLREQEAGASHELQATADPPADWEQLRPVLDAAMDELNDTDREAVLLRFFEGRAFVEVGLRLQLSENAARMRVDRALAKLGALLARRGVTSSAAALGIALTNQAVASAPTMLAASVTAGAISGITAGGAVLGTFTFMSMTKMIVGGAVLVAALSLGSSVYEAREARRANDSAVALRHERDVARATAVAAEAGLRAAEQNAVIAAEHLAALEKDLAAAKKSSAAVATPRATANAATSVWSKPGYAQLYVERYRASLASRYAPFYRALNLSADQIVKFEVALTNEQQGLVDIWTAASAHGLESSGDSPTSTAVARMTSEPNQTKQEALKALFGDEGLKAFRQFNEAKSAQDFVTTLAGTLYSSDAPLTSQQGEALVGLLRSNTKIVRTRMADDGKGELFLNTETTDWNAVGEQAQTVLSPSQITMLRALSEQNRIEREMNNLLNGRATSTAKSPGG